MKDMIQVSLGQLAKELCPRKRDIQRFIFFPEDYEIVREKLLASESKVLDWDNAGYSCYVERSDSGEVFYDLLLNRSGTVVMYGEMVEVFGCLNNQVVIRVPDDEFAYSFIDKEFFEKNFLPGRRLESVLEEAVARRTTESAAQVRGCGSLHKCIADDMLQA